VQTLSPPTVTASRGEDPVPLTAAVGVPGRRRSRTDLVPRIEAWLRARVGGRAEITIAPREAEGGGFSSDLYFVEVSGGTVGERERGSWVLRRERTQDSLFPLADFSAESQIQQALGRNGSVPVPDILWVEDDRAVLDGRFYVMERIHGDALPHLNDRGWVAEASPRQREALWREGLHALAAIHAFDWERAGLGRLRRAGDRPQLAGHLDYWEWLYQSQSEPAFAPLVRSAFDRLRRTMPAEQHCSLCWGDARHQNMLFRDGRCVAVLDWEMATLGAPETDVAFLLASCRVIEDSGIERLEGFPSREETARLYETISGGPLRDLPYYEGFALLRMLVIQARFMRLGLMPRDPQPIEENAVARLLRDFVDETTSGEE
jgi:aminoglycoside phosphotransferase (APT) family kinase protein